MERTPVACGAIGGYEPERVSRVAEALGARLVHRDRHSILAADPSPVRWRSALVRGWAWGDQTVRAAGRVKDWRGAATGLGCCGLVAEPGRRRFVHSSASGIGPVYWTAEKGAIYFASRIDPLLRATDGPLSIDWDAWAGILATDQPIGDRTPFAEIRRLRPFSRLEHGAGGATVTEERWPWAGIAEERSPERAIGDAVGAMREVIGEVDRGPARCLLSGGRDSRIALSLLRERADLDLRAFTVPDPSGNAAEDRVADRVAEALGVPLERVVAPAAGSWARVCERALRADFQFARRPWLYALAPRLAAGRGPVADGLALDLFLPVWRVGDPGLMTSGGGRGTARHLWRIYHRRAVRRALERPLADALLASARSQYLAECERVRGHPQEIILAAYLLRTVRGVSTVPVAILGHQLDMLAPFVDHRVVSALMRVPAAAKADGCAARLLMRAVDPAVARIPFGRDLAGAPQRRSQPASSSEAEAVGDGPLGGHLADPPARASRGGGAPHGVRPPDALVLLSLWHRRYRGRLRDVDPAEVLA